VKINRKMIALDIFIAIVAASFVFIYSSINKKPSPKEKKSQNLTEVTRNETTNPESNKEITITEPTDQTGATAIMEAINSTIEGNNQFAMELYSQLKNRNGNILFSPYSISSAIAMVYEGSKGETEKEIQSVFHFLLDESLRRLSFSMIRNDLNNPNSKYELNVANALWVQNDYKFLDSYLSTIEQYYDGKATKVDFKNSTEEARQTINKWV